MKGTAGSPLVKKVSHLCEFTSAWVTVGEGFRGERVWGWKSIDEYVNCHMFHVFSFDLSHFFPVLLQ